MKQRNNDLDSAVSIAVKKPFKTAFLATLGAAVGQLALVILGAGIILLTIFIYSLIKGA